MTRFYVFRKLINFVAEFCEVTDANMNNYAGDIEIIGKDEDGNTIFIKVELKEGKKDGN